jgi:hypothetical protein
MMEVEDNTTTRQRIVICGGAVFQGAIKDNDLQCKMSREEQLWCCQGGDKRVMSL